MKRADVLQNNLLYPNRIIIQSIKELGDYLIEEREPKHVDQLKQFLENDSANTPIDFTKCKLESYADFMQKKTGRGAIHYIADIESKTRLSMIKWVSKGFSIIINQVGGWCLLEKDAKIDWIEEKPLSVEDIRILRFKNGTHYYAKIKNIDVVIDGEQKWNSEIEARENAKKFLLEL
jgi:hypothetical protein